MARYRVLPESEFEELQELVERAAELLASAGELSLPESLGGTGKQAEKKEPEDEDGGWVGEVGRYRISRSEWQYADVVAKEMDKRVFSMDELWNKVGPLIVTKANRPRDGLRTALERDDRFERVEDREGVWWRRVDQESENGD